MIKSPDAITQGDNRTKRLSFTSYLINTFRPSFPFPFSLGDLSHLSIRCVFVVISQDRSASSAELTDSGTTIPVAIC